MQQGLLHGDAMLAATGFLTAAAATSAACRTAGAQPTNDELVASLAELMLALQASLKELLPAHDVCIGM